MARILRNFQPALKNVFLKIKDVYPIIVACGRMWWVKIGNPMKKMKIALKRGFS